MGPVQGRVESLVAKKSGAAKNVRGAVALLRDVFGCGCLFAGGVAACAYGWGVAFDGVDDGAVELGAEGFVVGAGEVGAEVFAGLRAAR